MSCTLEVRERERGVRGELGLEEEKKGPRRIEGREERTQKD